MKYAIRPLGIIIVSIFGFLVIVSFYTDKSRFEYTGREMHSKVLNTNYKLNAEEAVKLGNARLVDLRDSKAFRLLPREGAVNIPLASILSEESQTFFSSDAPIILTSDDPADAHQAWMLLTQLGYDSLFVMEGQAIEKEPEMTETPTDPGRQ